MPSLKPVAAYRTTLSRRSTIWFREGPGFMPLFYWLQLQVGSAFCRPALVVEDYAARLVLPG